MLCYSSEYNCFPAEFYIISYAIDYHQFNVCIMYVRCWHWNPFHHIASQEQVKEKKLCFLTLAHADSTVSFAEYKGVLPPLFKPERRFRKFYCLKLNFDAQVSCG